MGADPTSPARARRVVALVGSAGALDAVVRVLAGLPDDFAASVVVLIHMAPDKRSQLVAVLAQRAKLPVEWARHGAPLAPGVVSVVPPGTHLLVHPEGEMLSIVSGAAPPSRPSADLLLATLATAVGNDAIAVVLSGGGHDGATGATAVHVCGGTVLATDEVTSSSYAMPQATIERDGAIDHIVALDEVAGLLTALVSGTELEPPHAAPLA